jgi:imidazoleglycerol-phosphate dehydratase
MSRTGEIERTTAETSVSVKLGLDGIGDGERETGVGFLDHMLDLVARHGHFDLNVSASGDLHTGAHHTVEDVGICIGQALDQALGDRGGIVRYGQATIPMDESRAACAIDVSGRGLCAFDGDLPPGSIGNTVHLVIEAGTNAHHMVEATFKAFSRALRMAVALDPTEPGVPSTKGTLV